MKVRLRNNSIRLRVTQTEVSALAHGEHVLSVTRLGPQKHLTFRLAAANVESMSATPLDAEVRIDVPTAQMEKWSTEGSVSLRAEQLVGSEDPLMILVEKDFACLAPREGDDDVDCFPHPESHDP